MRHSGCAAGHLPSKSTGRNPAVSKRSAQPPGTGPLPPANGRVSRHAERSANVNYSSRCLGVARQRCRRDYPSLLWSFSMPNAGALPGGSQAMASPACVTRASQANCSRTQAYSRRDREAVPDLANQGYRHSERQPRTSIDRSADKYPRLTRLLVQVSVVRGKSAA
jgi:hypothetical protein